MLPSASQASSSVVAMQLHRAHTEATAGAFGHLRTDLSSRTTARQGCQVSTRPLILVPCGKAGYLNIALTQAESQQNSTAGSEYGSISLPLWNYLRHLGPPPKIHTVGINNLGARMPDLWTWGRIPQFHQTLGSAQYPPHSHTNTDLQRPCFPQHTRKELDHMVPSFPRLHLAVKAANFDLTDLPAQKTAGRVSHLPESSDSPRLRTNNGNLDRTLPVPRQSFASCCNDLNLTAVQSHETSPGLQRSLRVPIRST